MKKVSRPYLKNKRLILGSEKTQNDRFLSIAAVSAPRAGEVIGKIFGRGKERANKRPSSIEKTHSS